MGFLIFKETLKLISSVAKKSYDSIRLYRNSFQFPNYRKNAKHMRQIKGIKQIVLIEKYNAALSS